MRVFITGASGWIGSATVDELLANGYDVTGLARSDASAASLEEKGATVLRGDLDDLESLRKGSADADAVIHLANKHDWSNPKESDRAERAAVEAIGDVLVGTNKPFLVAAAMVGLAAGRPSTENDRSPWSGPEAPRGGTENLALDYVEKGVKSIILRFAPTVHGDGDNGLILNIVAADQAKGLSAYIADGSTGWAAVYRGDVATMIRLGLEKAPAGAVLHAVGEGSVSSKSIAEEIGRGLGIPVASIAPEEAEAQFGFIGAFFGMDISSSSALTQELLGWTPTGPTLVEDLASGSYYRS